MDFPQYTAAGCPPVRGLDVADRPNCRAFNDHAMRVIEDMAPDVVVLVARWESYMARLMNMDGVQATVNELNELESKLSSSGRAQRSISATLMISSSRSSGQKRV